MSRLTTVADLAAGDAIPESWVDAVRVAANYVTQPGANLASAATINITSEFHRVTGTANVDNISDASGAVDGQEVMLFTTGACTIRNNGAGTGNIRTATGADFIAAPNTSYLFAFDATANVWRQFAAGGGGSSTSVVYDSGVLAASTSPTLDSGNVIVAGWAAFEIYFAIRSASIGNTTNLLVRFNGDTGAANYSWTRSQESSASARSDAGNISTNGVLLVNVPGSTGLASTQAVGRLIVPNYDNTAFHKDVVGEMHGHDAAADYGAVYTGRWKSTAAITSVQITDTGGGNIAIGSRMVVRKLA